MKTIDEQIEYMKSEVRYWDRFQASPGKPKDVCQSILDTLEKVKAEQNKTPESR